MLTARREKFAINLFKGIPQREAYLQAGFSSRHRSLPALDVDASRLANSPQIILRVNELRSKVTAGIVSDKIMSETERREKLSLISRAPVKEKWVKPRDVIASIQEQNKMDKLYETGAINYTEIKILVVREDASQKCET